MMVEVQGHGFEFERWLRLHFFGGYLSKYSAKWDIAPEHNIHEAVPTAMQGLPVSVKTAKIGTPIGLGDALRQFTITEDFLLIVGYWRQSGNHKNFAVAKPIRVSAARWRELWQPITETDLRRLDALIKDRCKPYAMVQSAAKAAKQTSPYCDAKLVLNPKIDSKGQRRLQCSLPFTVFWNELVGEPLHPEVTPLIFGQPLPNLLDSPPRRFAPRADLGETLL